jgi:hypothetical protein
MRVTHGWVIVGVGALDPLLRIPEAEHLPQVERSEGELESDKASPGEGDAAQVRQMPSCDGASAWRSISMESPNS